MARDGNAATRALQDIPRTASTLCAHVRLQIGAKAYYGNIAQKLKLIQRERDSRGTLYSQSSPSDSVKTSKQRYPLHAAHAPLRQIISSL